MMEDSSLYRVGNSLQQVVMGIGSVACGRASSTRLR